MLSSVETTVAFDHAILVDVYGGGIQLFGNANLAIFAIVFIGKTNQQVKQRNPTNPEKNADYYFHTPICLRLLQIFCIMQKNQGGDRSTADLLSYVIPCWL